jgi:hypothetical protein
MEIAAMIGLLGTGFALTNYMSPKTPVPPTVEKQKKRVIENFESGSPFTQTTGPYKVRAAPVTPLRQMTGELDIQYALPSGGSIAMEPYPSDIKGLPTNYGTQNDNSFGSMAFSDSASPAPQEAGSSISPMVLLRNDGEEETPNYSRGQKVVSALTGVELDAGEFTHNNMVPFFRGSV